MTDEIQLAALLAHPLKGSRRHEAEKALSFAASWPEDGPLRAVAAALVPGGPPAVAAGDSLLVSVSETEQRSALWLLRAGRPSFGDPPLDAVAQRALDDARAHAFHDLPLLFEPLREMLPHFSPSRLFGSLDPILKGESYALAMYLSVMSRLLARPIPAHIVALASLTGNSQHQLGRVDALRTKVCRITGSALGVKTVLVASIQEKEARTALEDLGSALQLVPLTSRAAALEVVWPDLAASVPASWTDRAELRDVVAGDFDAALNSRSSQPWRGLAGALALMATRKLLDDQPPVVKEQWAYAFRIAQRHANLPASAVALPEPSPALLAGLGRERAEALRAHLVQAAADAGIETLPEMLEAAMPAPWIPTESQVKLAGAIGRGWASVRRYDRARAVLERAVDAWFTWWREDDSTFALCELIRVIGIQKDGPALSSLSQRWEAALGHACTPPEGKAFLRMAIGRAFVQVGRLDEALRWLGDREWEGTPASPRLQRRRRRWLARAYEEAGNSAEAAPLRVLLAGEQDLAFWLSTIDARLHAGNGDAGLDEALVALQAIEPQSMRALLRAPGSARERACVLAAEYVY